MSDEIDDDGPSALEDWGDPDEERRQAAVRELEEAQRQLEEESAEFAAKAGDTEERAAIQNEDMGAPPPPPPSEPPQAPGGGGGRRKPKCDHVLDRNAVCTRCGLALGLDVEGLSDAVAVAAEGRKIAEGGIPWLLDGVIPAYGMLGMLVAYAKVGKTTFGQGLGAAAASGADFIGRRTRQTRVLYVAAEDPPEYTAWLARHLAPEPEWMTFYRRSIILDAEGLARLSITVQQGGYGFVLIASWQAVVRGLIRDENDNAGAVTAVERVKAATRETGVPWIIDAHSGKGEDQDDEADPSKAQRGASAAAGAADYTLWLRYADGAFGTKRRLSGKGRFVLLSPQTLDYDEGEGTFDCLGDTKSAAAETTWRQIRELGAITEEPRSANAIALAAGMAGANGKVGSQARRRVQDALRDREGVVRTAEKKRGRTVTVYHLAPEGGEDGQE